VLTLGVQDVSFHAHELQRALDRSSKTTVASSKPMTACELFGDLGLGPVTALDRSDYEGAEIIFDLNEPDPPSKTRQRFGLIVNGGTLEHVFHVPNALANLNSMLKPGGAILHVTPCNNWVDHGFYQFSPTLMFDYYAALQFDMLESAMMIFNPRRNDGHLWEVKAAPSGLFGASGLDDRTYLHVVLVRRGSGECERAIPIQSLYAEKPSRPRSGPRWFSHFDLSYGRRIDRPNRQILPLTNFEHDEGFSWIASVPDLKAYADGMSFPTRSPLVVLEDDRPLGPAHASHEAIRARGGGLYSHWHESLYISASDDSHPNGNGRRYVAILPAPSSF
jgi:Methyltransferase domain